MMERFYYSSKYQCLYLKPILNLDHLTSTFTNWIEEYHTQKPHYAHGIYTPQEVLEGANLKICFKEIIKNASKLRREVNKNVNCIKKCVE